MLGRMLVLLQGSGPVLWTYTGRKTFPPFKSLPVIIIIKIIIITYIYNALNDALSVCEIASVNTALLGGYLHSTKTRAK